MPLLPNKNAPERHGQIVDSAGQATAIARGINLDNRVIRIKQSSYLNKVDSIWRKIRNKLVDIESWPHRKSCVPIPQRRHTRPRTLRRSAQDSNMYVNIGLMQQLVASLPEYIEQLVYLRVSGKEGALGDHLRNNTTDSPHVHWQGICFAPQKYFRRSIPERYHLKRC